MLKESTGSQEYQKIWKVDRHWLVPEKLWQIYTSLDQPENWIFT